MNIKAFGLVSSVALLSGLLILGIDGIENRFFAHLLRGATICLTCYTSYLIGLVISK